MGLPEGCLPEHKLPECWSDDVRMNALFAPFRLKSANPESWEMKMKFWSEMLKLWCQCKMDPIVSAADAKNAFQRKGRTPACLEIVVEECFRNNTLSPIAKYQQILHNGPETWIKWGARLAFKPASIALTAVSLFLPGKQLLDGDGLPKASIDINQRFVLESAVQEQAISLLESYPTETELVGTIEELMLYSAFPASKRETFEILLGYLVSQGLAVKKGDLIKLAQPNKKVEPISESDEALAQLLSAERRLMGDAARLARDAEIAGGDARVALQVGKRIAAKNHLRRKHTLLSRIAKCESTLENVRQLLSNIREMETNQAVFDTYKMSSEAMKRNMQDGGLDEDSVLDTMDDLKEVLDTYNSIETALSTPADDTDNQELEEELRHLLDTKSDRDVDSRKERRSERNDADTGRRKEMERDVADGSKALPKLPTPPSRLPRPRVPSERDFVFDGEARMLAELNELGDSDTRRNNQEADVKSKPWYPSKENFLLDKSLEELCEGIGELKTDERLHPGQKLVLHESRQSPLYTSDFQVRDHLPADKVWLYNKDVSDTDLATSTEYPTSSSPGKSASRFQMAPGGERKHPHSCWNPDDELQHRLDNLRGFTS